LRSALTAPLSQPLNAPARQSIAEISSFVLEALVTGREAAIGCAADQMPRA
jgi:hypothetical protein